MAQYEIYSKTSSGYRGDLIEKYNNFTATLRFNEVGKWSIKGSGTELCPLAENGGIIVYRDGLPFISGYVTKIDEEFDETFEGSAVINWEASGLDDNGLLTRRIIIPDPVNLNMTAEAYQTIQNYGGNAILDFIATQAGQQAHADRKISNLDVGDDLNVGSVKTYKARLDNLWEFIIGIAENQTLGVRVIWDGVSGNYEAQVYTPEDKSSTIIFSRELGNLKKWKRTREAPKANALWVAGQGELTERMFSYLEDSNSISKWGRYEGFKDQRQISKEQDPDDSRTPQEILDEAAEAFLSENLETEGYELELAPIDRLVYRTDWELGDIVQVRIGIDSYNALIEEVKIEYANMTEKIIPCVGTIDRGTISKTYQTIQSLSDRVTTLEKDEGIMDVFNDHDHDGTDSKKIAYANVTGTPEFETSAANIKPNGATSSVGSATTIARADHVHMGAPMLNNDGSHNSIYRGSSLGTSVTTAQWTAISNGTFDDMYIGDYWTIKSVVWRIAAFNYFYNCGDTAFTSNHVTIVPDTSLASSKMNDTDTTAGGYYGSGMRASGSGLATATTIINSAFSGHVATHRQYLTNAVTGGRPSAGSWYDCSVELMSEIMVYGCGIFKPVSDGTTIVADYTISKSQLPLFALNPKLIISSRYDWWLRDVVSAAGFATVRGDGFADNLPASFSIGVRPAFSIIG